MHDDSKAPRPGSGVAAEPPMDRIFLADHVRAVDIGAYAEERGRPQRLSFNISLEVARATADLDDRAARVVSYDDLIGAIDALIAGPRMSLLETFAERLAQACLIDPRARRVTVRIEKLDRLESGRLGVEITRLRGPEADEKVWTLGRDHP